MARLKGVPQETFDAMHRIRETALVRFDSLFAPERTLWSLPQLKSLHELFVERFDQGEGTFLQKWSKQLEGADDNVLQLAAELLYVQQFFASVIGPERKLENVRMVLSWSSNPPSIPEWAIEGVQYGLARDQTFNQHRPFHLAWLIDFLIHWQELPENDRKERLLDPWQFSKEVRQVSGSHGAYQPMQEAWLYICFPEAFENISSRNNKKQIRDAFNHLLTNGQTDNIDADILDIRQQLTSQAGEGFHFYRTPIAEQWQKANVAHEDMEQQGFTIVDKERRSTDDRLPTIAPPRVWIEDTKTAAHGHGGPGWEFGTCLWSPSAYEGGGDSYSLMREPKIDDLVIHINDGIIVGWSYVASPFREVAEGPPSPGRWAGRPSYYRIDLKGYQEFPHPISLEEFVERHYPAIESEMRSDAPKRYIFILYGGREVRHAQGAYLTRCTPRLYDLIRTSVFNEGPAEPALATNASYWTMAAGEGGRLWDEFQEKGIAAIGWDEFDLGDLTKYGDRESIQSLLVERRGRPGPTPSNDALCLFQFSHEMSPGDYIVAKVGRRRLLGVGLVESGYFLDETRSEYKHCRRVKWLSSHPVELPEGLQLGTKTLTDVTAYQDFVGFVRDQYFESHATPTSSSAPSYSIEEALETLFMQRGQLEEILGALNRKKNVILQGPPGVGKTFTARHIAFTLLGERDQSRVEMVQFHQSYAYEDFVQGWRPKAEGGFRLKEGAFLEFCNRARIDSARKYVFIIDEINRGNLSKILGELMMLIEADKRGAKFAIPLTYSESDGERFSVPENVYLLGLMNTADRSLALVDYALRRRFIFFSMSPALASDNFGAQLHAAGGSPELVDKIRRGVSALNKQISADSDLGDGFLIGHSFFCPATTDAPIDDGWYQAIVNSELAPLIREYWFDKKSTEVDEIIRRLREAK